LREALPTEPSSIRGFTIPDILAQSGLSRIDILKLDIEGTEKRLFSHGCEAWIGSVGAMIVEIHGQDAEELVLRVAAEHGFAASRRGEKLILVRDERRRDR